MRFFIFLSMVFLFKTVWAQKDTFRLFNDWNEDDLQWITFVCGHTLETENVSDTLYINPSAFQKRTAAFYSFSQNDTVTLSVYNYIGQLIIPIYTASVMPSGNYQDSVYLDTYPDGSYYVSIKLGSRKTITKHIVKSSVAGVQEIDLLKNLKFYPNPANDFLNIETNGITINEIEVTDLKGITILKMPFSEKINISNLSPSTYFLQINSDQGKNTYKFIKN